MMRTLSMKTVLSPPARSVPTKATVWVGAVAVKVAREKHDLRFDIPCLGARTLETCAAAKIAVLALEPGKTLLLEREACAGLAKKHKISVVTPE